MIEPSDERDYKEPSSEEMDQIVDGLLNVLNNPNFTRETPVEDIMAVMGDEGNPELVEQFGNYLRALRTVDEFNGMMDQVRNRIQLDHDLADADDQAHEQVDRALALLNKLKKLDSMFLAQD